ncbi:MULTISPECIES: MoaD/ThiS family protein [Cupriavidus]|uniref:Carrier, ThiamineS motif n=2 Tax=Cupriavidus TaxID=106589 RepID=A0A375CGI5_9BURK|nr:MULTISPECIES: MoaD/ThiS family protein [Cupriavidus]MBB3007112.1 molybdopterin converting factor small subunit [Cupriavidus alkaliphilus]MBB3015013.1 molybdopterin converting factor small subunit [Cupriavidus alkaliphilus]NOV24710.1 MoaD/ThiS family protein [Cupriavidus necator]PVY77157.1 molybdopterin synthase subunit MoaD [Cupriavidus alkaliphilus]RAS05933.1 molybdopterin synthase subunit MoaD [Cupriavidus alkaliphilus]
MQVRIATPLFSYTGQREYVEARGASIAELLDDLERQFPGMRFRIVDEQGKLRPYIRVFVNRTQLMRLDAPLQETDEVHILQALAGG